MALLLTTVTALAVWVVLWSLGVSGFDAFLVGATLVVATVMISTLRSPGAPAVGRPAAVPSRPVRRVRAREAEEGNSLLKYAWWIGGLLTAVGLGLWIWALAISTDTAGRLSELGSALLSGAVVAFAVLYLERQFDARAERQNREIQARAERQSREIQARAENQAARLLVALQRDLSHVDLSDLELPRAVFTGRDLTNARFERTKLAGARFVRSTLVDAAFLGADLTNVSFIDCDLTGAKFSQAVLARSTFTGANLTDALFTDARQVEQADFRLSYYRTTPPVFDDTLPTGISQAT